MKISDKEFLMCENIRQKVEADNEKVCTPLEDLAPFLPATENYYVSVTKETLKDGRYCFALCSSEGDHTLIISDGTEALPICLRDIVIANGWLCLCVQNIDSNNTSEVDFIIYYDSEGKISISDCDVNAMGLCSEICMFFSLDDCIRSRCSTGYMASFNFATLCLGKNDADFCCEISMTGELRFEIDYIDWIDMSGIKYLEQCLKWRNRTI